MHLNKARLKGHLAQRICVAREAFGFLDAMELRHHLALMRCAGCGGLLETPEILKYLKGADIPISVPFSLPRKRSSHGFRQKELALLSDQRWYSAAWRGSSQWCQECCHKD